jgi:hypothetical protein
VAASTWRRPLDRFAVVEVTTRWSRLAEVLIDGEPLRASVHDAYERRASARGSLGSSERDDEGEDDADELLPVALVAPPSRHWLGRPHEEFRRGDRVGVLNCTCGDFGCGGTVAQIEVGDGVVEWRGFRSVWGGPDLELGPFHFDRKGYEAALNRLGGPR